jgi:hypothetical protein
MLGVFLEGGGMNMRGRERLTPEQEIVYDANLRLELYKLSRQRLGEWLAYHIDIYTKGGMEGRITLQGAVQMLTSMLADGLNRMEIDPDAAGEELRRIMYERLEGVEKQEDLL